MFWRKVAGPCTLDFETIAGRNAMSSTHCGKVRHQAAHPLAAFAVLLPAPWALHHSARLALEQLDLAPRVERFTMLFDQQWFVVVKIALAGGTRHEELDHPTRPCRVMQPTASPAARFGRRRIRCEQAFRAKQVRKRDTSQAASGVPQEATAIKLRSGSSRLLTQSINANSLVLSRNRQALASPCLDA